MSKSKVMIDELQMYENIIRSIEENVEEINDLLHRDYLDEAIFRIQNVYNQLVTSSFDCSLLKKSIDSHISYSWHIQPDGCGGFEIVEYDACGTCCTGGGVCCAIFSLCCLMEMCCPGAGASSLDACLTPCCDMESPACICNCCDCCCDCYGQSVHG